jgi:hypothetical protein
VWGSGGIALSFLTSAADGGEWSASRPGRFNLWERSPGTHCIVGFVGLRVGLDAVEKREKSLGVDMTTPNLKLRPQ